MKPVSMSSLRAVAEAHDGAVRVPAEPLVALEERHPVAPGEQPGGGQAGGTAADHHHMALLFARAAGHLAVTAGRHGRTRSATVGGERIDRPEAVPIIASTRCISS